MNQSQLKHTSVFLSLILRHNPGAANVTLDRHGWAEIDDLIHGVNSTGKYTLDRETLEYIVKTDNKQRYSISDDGKRIRANQGHSIRVDVELEEKQPPEFLYHGTAEKYRDSIMSDGLKPKSRLYVHLSKDKSTAVQVGRRHGKPVVLTVRAGDMYREGYRFYYSVNGVWLTKSVPVKYIHF